MGVARQYQNIPVLNENVDTRLEGKDQKPNNDKPNVSWFLYVYEGVHKSESIATKAATISDE